MNSKNKAAAEKKFNELFARELTELREHAQQWSAEEHERVQEEIHFERCEAAEAWCQSAWRSTCAKSHPELRQKASGRVTALCGMKKCEKALKMMSIAKRTRRNRGQDPFCFGGRKADPFLSMWNRRLKCSLKP